MRKTIILGVIMISTIFLGGCGKEIEIKENEISSNKINSDEIKNDKGEDTGNVNNSEVSNIEGNMLNKLKSAISSGKKMKCTYKMNDEDAEMEIITYVQGDKYKTETNFGQMKTISIFDGDVMYNWSVGHKTGTKMTMDCMNSLDVDVQENKEAESDIPKDEEDFVDSLEAAKNLQCESFDDASFDIPNDIEFADQCEMLKSQQKLMEGFDKK